MAVSSSRNGLSWSDDIGLLPLFVTLVLPLVLGLIVILKCVYNHCCLRKTTAKSYTVKPTLTSCKDTGHQRTRSNSTVAHPNEPTSSTILTVPRPNSNSSVSAVPNRGIAADVENRSMLPRQGSSGQWRSLVAENQQNSTNDNQVNFSGDSQDSRGGYTRLSVREPLSNVRNQAAPRRNVDPHYATVSDDSEEMYAAIENGDGKYNVYQKIQRKGGTGTAHDQADESEDEDEDEEDQFYEKLKSKAPSTHSVPSQLPAHSNPSVLKHGYEKIKPKCPITDTGNSDVLSTPQGIAGACGLKLVKVGTSSLESDEDVSLYERVKYSPYERVKESQDHLEKVEDFYEDINSSRVSKSNERTPNLNEIASRSDKSESVSDSCGAGGQWASATIILVPPPDIQNLYARVDVTKKKRNTIISIVP